MTDQHCPGFESNKQLKEVKVVCPACKAGTDLFADEMEKSVKCPQCQKMFDPKACQAPAN
jgi:uncharacterized CHY-type Zn-finger protein